MANVPKVQSISELMTDLAPGYNEQAKAIGQQQEAVGQQFEAQRQGLEAQKDRQFNVINDQATGRGASFSGIPLHEQADYLSTQYLPGVQASYAQENQQRLSLSQQLAQLRTEQRNRAFDTRQTQLGWVNDWNLNERNISATAEQARLSREFEAGQNALNRQHDFAVASHSASLSAASNAESQGPTVKQVNKDMNAWFDRRAGGDRKVNPSDFRRGYQYFAELGGGSFDDYARLYGNRAGK